MTSLKCPQFGILTKIQFYAKYCMVTIFVLKKFIRAGNYLLLTDRHIRHYLVERISMAIQQMIYKKNTISFI